MSRKQDILETARTLFNESNTQAVTTNHIAKAMGISPGNLHYHYKNREEIVRLLYQELRMKMTLSRDELPKTPKEIIAHQKVLIGLQWKYRFFFREILFLFSRDKALKTLYIKDNVAHRARIVIVIENLIQNGELTQDAIPMKEYIVDAILMTWQFYTSYMQTLGKVLNEKTVEEAVYYTNNAMKPYMKSIINKDDNK